MPRGMIFKEIRKLEKLRAKAIKRLLAMKEQIDAELKALGHGAAAAVSTYKKSERKRDPSKVCKVCGKKGHDGRRHRFEKGGKKAAA